MTKIGVAQPALPRSPHRRWSTPIAASRSACVFRRRSPCRWPAIFWKAPPSLKKQTTGCGVLPLARLSQTSITTTLSWMMFEPSILEIRRPRSVSRPIPSLASWKCAGEKPTFYDVTDVPHGEIRLLRYNSKSNGVIRELNVYTPPGYDDDPQRRFPVVYLLHGANNDHYSWYRYGRANDILDNLLAEGAIKPFIVVMPLGYGGASADGRRGPSGAGGGAGDLYEQDILEDIIPMVDAKYRTIADRKHRAIVGFSMGGGQSSRIGLGHLDTFSYIGVFSAGLPGNTETEPFKTLAADVAVTNRKIDLLWIACGKVDAAFAGAGISRTR